MSKSQGFLKDFWDNFEEYLCSVALVVMAVVTFMNVFSRKISWFNMSFSQELVATMFAGYVVWQRQVLLKQILIWDLHI